MSGCVRGTWIMSEYADIMIRKLCIFSFRNYLSGDIVSLFFTDRDYECIPNYIEYYDNEPYQYTKHIYKTTVKKAKERLDALGFSIFKFQKIFEDNIADAVYFDYIFNCDTKTCTYEEMDISQVEKNITFKKWKNAIKKVIKYELENGNITGYNKVNGKGLNITTDCDRIVYNSLLHENNFEHYGLNTSVVPIEYSIRLMLEYCEPIDEILLDFSNFENWSEESIDWAKSATKANEKTIVLVEGKNDKKILEFALEKLYPHLSDLYYFMDFEDEYGGKRDGGTSYLIKNLKTFYFSRIRSKFIAIFDNDAEGYQSKCSLENDIKTWPDNFRILLYPSIKLFRSYPTILPDGKIYNDDINKKACSIELYLPDKLIQFNGKYYPIEWEERKKINKGNSVTEYRYQGVISQKDVINKNFDVLYNKMQKGKLSFVAKEWDRMKQIIDTIVFAYAK